MDIFNLLFVQMDRILLPVFRFPDHDVLGYFFGTFLLAAACVITGKYSLMLALRLNASYMRKDIKNADRFHDLSIRALKAGDRQSYKVCNRQANDAFSRTFFRQIAFSASYLWPAFTALGWMQYRFSGISIDIPVFPGKGISFGYVFSFVLCYASAATLISAILNVMPRVRLLAKAGRISI